MRPCGCHWLVSDSLVYAWLLEVGSYDLYQNRSRDGRSSKARPDPRSAQGGDPLPPPPEGYPRAWAARILTPAPGYRGAPARGVDVKPPPDRVPGSPQGPRKPLKRPKRPILAKNPDFGGFSGKWPFWGLFPGSRDSPRGGFYINPSRRPPRSSPGPRKGGFPGDPRKRPKKGLFGAPGPKSPKIGISGLPGPESRASGPAGGTPL